MARLWVGQPKNWGSTPGMGKDFPLPRNNHTGSGAYPVSESVGVLWAVLPELKQVTHEADHSPPPGGVQFLTGE